MIENGESCFFGGKNCPAFSYHKMKSRKISPAQLMWQQTQSALRAALGGILLHWCHLQVGG